MLKVTNVSNSGLTVMLQSKTRQDQLHELKIVVGIKATEIDVTVGVHRF